MGSTTIEWTDAVWNPVTGCTKVSAGCKNCYAERVFPRAYGTARKFTDVHRHDDRLGQPLRWRAPRRVFVNSMSDLFHEDIPYEFIDKVFMIMAMTPKHTYQVLTKRADRMKKYATYRAQLMTAKREMSFSHEVYPDALRNVWLGVSVEDQETADERITKLLATPAAVRFVSYEPALGPVDFTHFEACGHSLDALRGEWCSDSTGCLVSDKGDEAIDWIIAGGESGPSARPAQIEWFRSVRDQCVAAGVPFFFKQWGEWAPRAIHGERPLSRTRGEMVRVGKKTAGAVLDGKNWRDFPNVASRDI